VKVAFRAIGNWREGDVITSRAQGSRFRDPAVEKLIDAAWREASNRQGLHIFDGPMTRLERFTANEKLHLELSRTSYRVFWGTNLNHPQVPPEARANAVGMSCALESGDGALVLGRRTSSVAYYPSRIHPFAGALEPADSIDVFAEIRRELREELSLDRGEIAGIVCLGIIEDSSIFQPELIFWARCTLNRAEIEQRLDAKEHERCIWVEPTQSAVQAALDNQLLTPVALGTVLLWGRERFSIAWFDAAARARNLQP
jgi:hypothetical protein